MSTSLLFKTKTLAVAVSSVILVACGGSSSKSNNPPDTSTTTVKGYAVDGALFGSTVVFEDCENKTTTTAEDGSFTFPENCTSSNLTVTGGIDTALGINFTGTLKAPKVTAKAGANQIAVTPITTLIAAAGGADQAAALAKALGLEGIDLLSVNPLTNKDVYAKTVAAQQLIEEIQETILALGGNVSFEEANTAAIKALSAALTSTTATNPNKALSDPSIIAAALKGTLEEVKNKLPDDIKTNLDRVKDNLASLTAKAIASNVESVQTAIQNLPNLNASSLSSAAAGILEAKESVVTEIGRAHV